MKRLNRFEIFILSVAVLLVLAGIWGVNYEGFGESGSSANLEKFGEVSEIRKASEVKRRATQSFHWANLDQAKEIFEKDTVYVGPGSELKVTLVDQSEITIGEDSLVIFEKSKMMDSREGEAGIFLVKGEMSVQGNEKQSGDQVLAVALENQKTVSIPKNTGLTISKRNKVASIVVSKPGGGDLVFKESGREIKKLNVAKDSKPMILQRVNLASKTPIQIPDLKTFDIPPVPVPQRADGRAPAKNADEKNHPLIRALREDTQRVQTDEAAGDPTKSARGGETGTKAATTASSASAKTAAGADAVDSDSTEILFKPASVSNELLALQTTDSAVQTEEVSLTASPTQNATSPAHDASAKTDVPAPVDASKDPGALVSGMKGEDKKKAISDQDAEEETKNESSEVIALIFPKNEATYDFRSKIAALDFRFRVKSPNGKSFVLQFSPDSSFRSVILRTLIEKSDLVAEETDTKGAKYATALSGLYLAFNEGFMKQVYSGRKLYWRVVVIDEKTKMKQASRPRMLSFEVRDTVKIQTQVSRVKDARAPASGLVPQLVWQVVGQFPTQYRISFSKDGNFNETVCTDTVPSSLSYYRKDERVSHLNLWSEEKYNISLTSICQNGNAIKGLKKVFYKVDAIGVDGKPIKYERPALARGALPLY